ncbi:MAG: DUF5615 family PIN-like protein [Candidatus Atribacteria bacterium]|nr:DUF5615 family PIN-like protein [Candidatus Atribacteria bacterium]
MICFLADEDLHYDIVKKLRQNGYEVLFVPEIGLQGKRDSEILHYALVNDLVLISGDKDFGGLIQFGKLWKQGKVILLRYRLIDIQRIVRDIQNILYNEIESLINNVTVIIVLSERGYRIHASQ